MSNPPMGCASYSEPLHRAVGYPIDESLIETWRSAVLDLMEEADTPLPDMPPS